MGLLALFMNACVDGVEISPGGAILLTVLHGDREHQAWIVRTGPRRVRLVELDARRHPRTWSGAERWMRN